jgi:hypothetical protein
MISDVILSELPQMIAAILSKLSLITSAVILRERGPKRISVWGW